VLNPVRLRLLCQLETLGTVRAVAQAEHLSPSSVSQQLSVLERECGSVLFVRSGRRLQLTTAGPLLAGRAREILDAMTAATIELRSLGGVATGTVRVASFQSAIHALVLPAARNLGPDAPEVEVQVVELESHLSPQALLRGDVDVIVTTTDFLDAPLRRDLHLVPLTADAIVLVAPAEHRVASQETVDLATLADEPWTFELEDTWMANVAARLCRSAGFEPRVVCRFNNYLLALQHVEAGSSLTLLPALAVDPRYRVLARVLSPPAQRRIVAAIRSSSAPNAAVRAFLDSLRAMTPRETAWRQALADPRSDGSVRPSGFVPADPERA
jgi:DNA-binding transcriptional LysR family regulator